MKRPINANGYAGRVLGIIALLLLPLPAALSLLAPAWPPAAVLARASLAAGGALLAGFLLWLGIEALQDAAFDRAYRRQRGRRLALPDGGGECQFCGSRRVKAGDLCCPSCGREFTD